MLILSKFTVYFSWAKRSTLEGGDLSWYSDAWEPSKSFPDLSRTGDATRVTEVGMPNGEVSLPIGFIRERD